MDFFSWRYRSYHRRKNTEPMLFCKEQPLGHCLMGIYALATCSTSQPWEQAKICWSSKITEDKVGQFSMELLDPQSTAIAMDSVSSTLWEDLEILWEEIFASWCSDHNNFGLSQKKFRYTIHIYSYTIQKQNQGVLTISATFKTATFKHVQLSYFEDQLVAHTGREATWSHFAVHQSPSSQS